PEVVQYPRRREPRDSYCSGLCAEANSRHGIQRVSAPLEKHRWGIVISPEQHQLFTKLLVNSKTVGVQRGGIGVAGVELRHTASLVRLVWVKRKSIEERLQGRRCVLAS